MNKTTIVNIRKVKGQRPKFDIYIGRAVRYTEFKKSTIWSNPFFGKGHPNRNTNVALYEDYIRDKIKTYPDKFNIESLRGKILGCWCKPLACHGDILIKILEETEQ